MGRARQLYDGTVGSVSNASNACMSASGQIMSASGRLVNQVAKQFAQRSCQRTPKPINRSTPEPIKLPRERPNETVIHLALQLYKSRPPAPLLVNHAQTDAQTQTTTDTTAPHTPPQRSRVARAEPALVIFHHLHETPTRPFKDTCSNSIALPKPRRQLAFEDVVLETVKPETVEPETVEDPCTVDVRAGKHSAMPCSTRCSRSYIPNSLDQCTGMQ